VKLLSEFEKTMNNFPSENKIGSICNKIVRKTNLKDSFHFSNPTPLTSTIMISHWKIKKNFKRLFQLLIVLLRMKNRNSITLGFI
jgi:hypothetical protein